MLGHLFFFVSKKLFDAQKMSIIAYFELLPVVVMPLVVTIVILISSWIFQPAISHRRIQNQERPTLTVSMKPEKAKSRSRKSSDAELESVELPNPPAPYEVQYDLSVVIPAYNEVRSVRKLLLPIFFTHTLLFLEGKITTYAGDGL